MSTIKLFEDKNVRAKWNDDEDCWWFVVQDIIAFLTDSDNPIDYWYRLKKRVYENEGFQLSTICRQLKFTANNRKEYKYECANNEGLFRIIQSIPSPKAEPFKRWLAKLGKERIEEIEQPQKAIDRAKGYYISKGYSKEWVETRTASINTRNSFTDTLKDAGIKGKEYGILTDELYKSSFGFTSSEYKEFKGLPKDDSLRDNMTPLELASTIFSEATSTEIITKKRAKDFSETKEAIHIAGNITKDAIIKIEKQTGKPIISKQNYKHLNTVDKAKQIIESENKELSISNKEFDNKLKRLLSTPPENKDISEDDK